MTSKYIETCHKKKKEQKKHPNRAKICHEKPKTGALKGKKSGSIGRGSMAHCIISIKDCEGILPLLTIAGFNSSDG